MTTDALVFVQSNIMYFIMLGNISNIQTKNFYKLG
jgi:hypothetical protein